MKAFYVQEYNDWYHRPTLFYDLVYVGRASCEGPTIERMTELYQAGLIDKEALDDCSQWPLTQQGTAHVYYELVLEGFCSLELQAPNEWTKMPGKPWCVYEWGDNAVDEILLVRQLG